VALQLTAYDNKWARRLSEETAATDEKLAEQENRVTMLFEDQKADIIRRFDQFAETVKSVEESVEEMTQFMDELDSATADNLQKTGDALEAVKAELARYYAELKQEAVNREEQLTQTLTTMCTQIFTALWKDPEELKRKDEQLEKRLDGMEALFRKRVENMQIREEKLHAVDETDEKFRDSIQRQVDQLEDAIGDFAPQVRELYTSKHELTDLISQNEQKLAKTRIN